MLHAFHDVLFNGLRLVEWRVLWQIAHGISRAPNHIALILLVESCDDLHECRLTGSVKADNTDFRSVEEAQIDVLQYLFLVLLNGLADSDH